MAKNGVLFVDEFTRTAPAEVDRAKVAGNIDLASALSPEAYTAGKSALHEALVKLGAVEQ